MVSLRSVGSIAPQQLTRRFGTREIAHEQEKLLTALVLGGAAARGAPNLRIEHAETSDRAPRRCRPVHFGARAFRVLRSNGIATARNSGGIAEQIISVVCVRRSRVKDSDIGIINP